MSEITEKESNTTHINGLIYIETILEEEYNLNYPFFKFNGGLITYYVITPHIFKTLDEYTNYEIEHALSHHENALFNNTLLDKIIQIAFHIEDLTYLYYLKKRNISFTHSTIKLSILNGIAYIFSNSENSIYNGDQFLIIRFLIENYNNCISITEILFMYIANIHYRIIDNNDVLDKNIHMNNIGYLMNYGTDLNFRNETDYYSYYSIKEMLCEINYMNDVYWVIRKDYIMFIFGTNLHLYSISETEHIEKYLSDELIMKEILSYI